MIYSYVTKRDVVASLAVIEEASEKVQMPILTHTLANSQIVAFLLALRLILSCKRITNWMEIALTSPSQLACFIGVVRSLYLEILSQVDKLLSEESRETCSVASLQEQLLDLQAEIHDAHEVCC